MNLLDRIDAALDGLCPCGGQPREGSAYCGPDCEPTHIAEDTDAPGSGTPTPMRWRPDLVTAADDTDLIPLGSETHGYTGRYNAQVYERVSDPTIWHLRLDDGHRFVGVDLTDVGGRQDPVTGELVGRVREAWQRLERELTDTRRLVPGVDGADDPWGDVMAAALSHGQAVVIVGPSGARRVAPCAVAPVTDTRERRSYHNQLVQGADVAAADLDRVGRMLRQSMQPMTAAAEAFLRDVGVQLTGWQRQVVDQMHLMQITHPRRFARPPVFEAAARLGFRPLVNAREATIFAQAGLREGLEFLRYPDAPEMDEPPDDPMLRAIEAKRNRNTGPPQDRLDGRRRRRR